jgi:hypothetical protein
MLGNPHMRPKGPPRDTAGQTSGRAQRVRAENIGYGLERPRIGVVLLVQTRFVSSKLVVGSQKELGRPSAG